MFRHLTLLLIITLCNEPWVALEAASSEELAEISIIALGPKPLRHYSMVLPKTSKKSKRLRLSTRGQSVLLKTPTHATPPTQLFHKMEGSQEWTKVNIGFNNQGSFTKIPALKEVIFFQKFTTEKASRPTLKLPLLKPNTKTLIFLTPTGNRNNLWENRPHATAIPLTWAADGASRFLFVNTSTQMTHMYFSNGKRFSLKPGSRISIDLTAPSNESRIVLKVIGENDSKFAIQTPINAASEIITVFAFFNASPKTNGGRTLGTFRAVYEAPKSYSSTN